MRLAPPLPPALVLRVRCPKARPDCVECAGGGVIPTMDGNRPCSRCGTTERDLVWDEVPNPERQRALEAETA